MTQPEYEQKKRECWEEFCDEHLFDPHNIVTQGIFGYAFDRAFVLGKQENDAEKKSALTDKEVYALESAISELESLIEGTLDEDYHNEQKNVIIALKRIIKKYEKK
ncbi:hypothetical protein EEL50_11385 [Muribaculaceae bacterium Isolate-105 (HZI)]|nr:hypothetical protein EEL50_11385 [Muribaculaceae bacterium Isolate-105 (HZI)]